MGIKRIGVLTSGGDAPGMNAAIRASVLAARRLGIDATGIRRGYCGLISSDVTPLTETDVCDITNLGGTMLYTARCAEFMSKKGQRRAADNCKFLGIDGLVVIGGDGSFQGAMRLYELGIPVVCIPGTIDNDMGCTSYTIGYDTACNTAIDAVDKLSDTMQSHERCSVVEVMGRKSGHLALSVGIATGATVILIPEIKIDFERDVIARVRRARIEGLTHFTIIVAEGAIAAHEAAGRINGATGIETRVTTLGHIQRGGPPLVRDRVTASRMGYLAAQIIASGGGGRVIAVNGGKCVDIELREALAMTKKLDRDAYTMQDALMG